MGDIGRRREMRAWRGPATVAVTALAAALTGCASAGTFQAANVTEVQLGRANYEVVATDVTGTAAAGYLFGVSSGNGQRMQTVAVARVTGPAALYAQALEELWDSFREEHGPVEGRDLALTNVRFDGDALNLLVFTRARVIVRADVVEFVEE